MVRFRAATKRYPDGTTALREVTLDVPAGQFCVVLGSSGAGKSTLLRAVTGLVTLSSGSVEVDGVPVAPNTLHAVRSKVGMVHQGLSLVGRASVLDNVLNGALNEVSTLRAILNLFPDEYRRKACALLADLGLTETHLYRRASELSGGQQQRVAIARAFILDPTVVLADEPVASLDMSMSRTILGLLRETSARRGTTVLCSLHQVDLAREFADRIVAMKGGEVIADGSPRELDDAALERIYGRTSLTRGGSLRPSEPAGGARPSGSAAAPPAEDEGAVSREAGERSPESRAREAAATWKLRQPFGKRALLVALLASVLLGFSGHHTGMGHLVSQTVEWIGASLGLKQQSEIGKGLRRFGSSAWPLVLSRETAVSRVEGFDRNHLPPLAHVETRERKTSRYDFEQKKMVETTESEEVLVEPVGYFLYVCELMLQSLEIALWGTLFALAGGLPLAYFGTRGYAPHWIVYGISRLTSSFLRAIPELVSALVFTLAVGFGDAAGVLALGFHSAGFFGKFYADDVENAERHPQEALFAVGANKLKVLRHAVLPQVLPQYIAYTQYILERNVRMATVIGIVGAGGIGTELKGRYDMFDYGHVSTIILVILVTVLLLEQLSQRLRGRLIAVA